MEVLSVFDMLKVGIGPSSSHTLGPWRAIQRWLAELDQSLGPDGGLTAVERIQVHLYGSLALTGRGHATDQAIALALLGHDPETVDVDDIGNLVAALRDRRSLSLDGRSVPIAFDLDSDIVFHPDECLPGHANAMTCVASAGGRSLKSTYFSVGGGFVLRHDELGDNELGEEGTDKTRDGQPTLRYPTQKPDDLRSHCVATEGRIADVVWTNELAWRTPDEIRAGLDALWQVMVEGVYRGCHTVGTLPGGLGVQRRAAPLVRLLLSDDRIDDDSLAEGALVDENSVDAWLERIRGGDHDFGQVLQWISAFAMATNEENANLGRVVTAPTNGAAGVIPAVLLYYLCLADDVDDRSAPDARIVVHDFLLVAGEVGTLFKKGATISAAMGGCMAEVGVSSAMAAAALTEAMGGNPDQALMAAEIAMEHHLGMTCDPVSGLVQVPCIERNTMGAVKAINAAGLAIAGDPAAARVTLAEVIDTMRDTAESMSDRFKETSLGGLAVNVSVRVPEC
ncbi:MAG: L-serine ammonia-lyase, iron-sulfur-dependent, subunit alpha [Candidatus Microthrix sp.]|jgi:L-serine dehydratase|nr:L-serine ammonia-lyase, iron-sulfur-dependent, subunit alpha [Candidatus Microthrix sp.]